MPLNQLNTDPIGPGDDLDSRLAKTYEFLCRFCETYPGSAPTLRAIRDALGISSTATVSKYLNTLARQGKVKRYPTGGCRGYVPAGGSWQRPGKGV